ncbi:hypothetical protein ACQP0C_39310 [Nocardia sp. CA-129566]|uniref:hypothetical protein n=1 Tax=Nocardia sp. CA-129566 TaxID=3239976 RepID=UPI003D95375C
MSDRQHLNGSEAAVRGDIATFAQLAGVSCATTGPACDWEQSQSVFGVALPEDYRAFVDAFGAGTVGDRLTLLTPWPELGTGKPVLGGWRDVAAEIGSILRGHRSEYPEYFPYAFYPESGGLLNWAQGVGGEQCFWLTEDPDPSAWPIVIWDKAEWYRYGPGTVALLIRALSGDDPFLTELIRSDPDSAAWTPSD